MAKPFNLTAQLNLVGPANLRPVVNNLRKQLSGINTNVTVNISRGASRGVNILNKHVQGLTKSLQQANTQATTLSATMSNLSKALSNMAKNSKQTSTNLTNTGNAAKQVGQNVQQAATQMEEFGRISGLALRRYAGFTVATTLTFGFARAVSNAVGEALKFERELIKVAQVTGNTTSSLKSLTEEIGRLSTGLGVSSTELLEVSRTLAQAGLSANETKKALDALAKSALAPTFNDIRNTTEGVIAVMSQFGIRAKDMEKVLGSLNAVAGSFAVEAEDLISVIRRTGGVFKAASGDIGSPIKQLNELVAVFTSVRATTRESAESIATGLRTIFTRIQRPSTLKFLNQLGVNLQDLEGKFVGPYKAMQLLNEALKSLDPRDVRFAKIVEQLGGFRQVGKLIPAIQQFGKAQEALGVAMAGQGSLARDAEKAQQSLLVQTQKVREEFLQLFRDITGDNTFQIFAKGALGLASSLIKLADSFKPILPMITALATIKAGSALKQFGTGFFGGLRSGGGAQAVGQNLAGGATGSGSSAASQALQNITKANTVAIQANTKATIANTIALNALLRTQAGLRPARPMPAAPLVTPRLGGPIYPRQFNTGGFVPGKGNYDSVPAMLTPGEFVVKKSAAQALGPDYLNSMNRKQRGGKIRRQRFANGGKVEVAVTDEDYGGVGYTVGDHGKSARRFGMMPDRSWSSKSIETVYNQIPANMLPAESRSKNDFKANVKKSSTSPIEIIASPYISYMNDNLDKVFEQAFETQYDAMVNNVLKAGFNAPSAQSLSQAVGNEPSFEEIKTALTKELQPGTISGLMFQGFTNAFTRTKPADDSGSGRWDLFPSTRPELFKEMFDEGISRVRVADNKNKIDSNSVASIVDKAISTGSTFKVTGRLQDDGLSEEAAALEARAEQQFRDVEPRVARGKQKAKRKASGGSIAGSDTVPALLTPGEFVINRESASKIGLSNLTKMNRGQVAGYASGGLVTGSRHAYGPAIDPTTMLIAAGSIASMAGSAVDSPVMGAAGAGLMGGTTGMAMLGAEASKTAKAVTFLAGGAYAAYDAFVQAQNELKKLEAQKKIDSALEDVNRVMEKFAGNIETQTQRLESSFNQLNAAVQRSIEAQVTDPQSGFTALRGLLGSNDAIATRIENQVGFVNLLFADIADYFSGGNRGGELRERGLRESVAQEAAIAAPAAEAARGTLQAKIRERALRDQAAGIDIQSTEATDSAFRSENAEQIRAMVSAEEEFIQLRIKLQGQVRDGTLNQAQATAQLNAYTNERVRQLEEETEMLLIAEQAGEKFSETLDLMQRRFTAIAAVAVRVGEDMQNMEASMGRNIGAAQGAASFGFDENQFSSVFSNMAAYTQAEIASSISNLGSATGLAGNESFDELANVVSTTTSLQAQLPQLIQDSLNESGGALSDDFANTLEAKITEATGGADDPVISEMLNSIITGITAGEGRQSDIGQEAINNLVNQSLEKLSERAEVASKAMEEIAKVMDEQLKRLGEAINTQAGLIQAANAAQERVNQISFRQAQQMAELTGQELSLDELFAPFESQLKSLTGGLTDPNAIANQRAGLEAERRELETKMSQTSPGSDEMGDLASEAAQVTAALNQTHAALELLASDTTRQAALVQKLNKLNEARSGAQNIMEAIMTGDPQELMKFTRGMNLVAAQQTGMLNTSMIGNEDRGLLFQMFRMLQPLAGADAGLGIPKDAFSTGGLIDIDNYNYTSLTSTNANYDDYCKLFKDRVMVQDGQNQNNQFDMQYLQLTADFETFDPSSSNYINIHSYPNIAYKLNVASNYEFTGVGVPQARILTTARNHINQIEFISNQNLTPAQLGDLWSYATVPYYSLKHNIGLDVSNNNEFI